MTNKNTLLIADDNEINRELLAMYLTDDYDVHAVEDGQQAIDYLNEHRDTLVLLLDLYMPNKNGFEVLSEIQNMGLDKSMAVIIISGENAVEAEEKAFDLGATDFIHKPFENAIVKRRVDNVVELFASRNHLEKVVEKQTESIKMQNELLRQQAKKLIETNQNIIDILGTTVEFRHLDSYEHITRVKAFTQCLANEVLKMFPEFNLTKRKVDLIVSASSLHDIGKIAIPDSVLLKPGRFTPEEFEIMKSHTTQGAKILKRLDGVWDDDFAEVAYDICRHHHERFDGKGYPDKIAGDDIPISAQVVSVVDVYDALICKRCYKDAFSKDKAFEMIMNGECGVFNPKLLECFKNCRGEIERLADTIISKE